MGYRTVHRLLILCCALLGGPPAGAGDPRQELAERLVLHADVLADQQATRQMLTNITARHLFHGLRKNPDWNADHPLWRKHFAEFLRDYRALVNQRLGDVNVQQTDSWPHCSMRARWANW